MPLLDWGQPSKRKTISGSIWTWNAVHRGHFYELTARKRGTFTVARMVVDFGADSRSAAHFGPLEEPDTRKAIKEWAEDIILPPSEQFVLGVEKAKKNPSPRMLQARREYAELTRKLNLARSKDERKEIVYQRRRLEQDFGPGVREGLELPTSRYMTIRTPRERTAPYITHVPYDPMSGRPLGVYVEPDGLVPAVETSLLQAVERGMDVTDALRRHERLLSEQPGAKERLRKLVGRS